MFHYFHFLSFFFHLGINKKKCFSLASNCELIKLRVPLRFEKTVRAQLSFASEEFANKPKVVTVPKFNLVLLLADIGKEIGPGFSSAFFVFYFNSDDDEIIENI